ncbi:hypothetical protein TASIC1_0004001200 [Trichoderma asperellum]|uniref:Glycoside hydrolase n=1 Tax=Trichoderma asperellum TaxID=101201 RepID=A0A6V8QQ48_TRIAP|nr:hypothetical protein TASIC1_0004001200 [Trichoderma asperellum]
MLKFSVSLLAGAAMVAAFPPSIIKAPTEPVPDTVDFSVPQGNWMPSRTSPDVPSAANVKLAARATGEKVSNSNVARFDNSNIQDGVGDGVDSYTLYLGSGSTSAGWPDKSRWVSFENMFNKYKPQMFAACGNQDSRIPNTDGPEVGAIWDGIQMTSAATGVDHRFVLAILMQESHGCVRVNTTTGGVRNPGLMQDHNGVGSCNDNHTVQKPCPSATIYQMIREGTAGTSSGDGLANCINESGHGDVSDFYRGARIYNSGSVSSTGNLQSNIATHCYASDIAK